MIVLLLTIGVLALFFILMSVRTCASQSPFLNKEGEACGFCGKTITANDPACGDPKGHSEAFPEVKRA